MFEEMGTHGLVRFDTTACLPATRSFFLANEFPSSTKTMTMMTGLKHLLDKRYEYIKNECLVFIELGIVSYV